MRDIIVGHPAGRPFVIDRFVVIVLFGVGSDNVPGVKQTRYISKAKENDVQ